MKDTKFKPNKKDDSWFEMMRQNNDKFEPAKVNVPPEKKKE